MSITTYTSFPPEMKGPSNKIGNEYHSSDKIEGFVYDGADGSQMIYWECNVDGISEEHTHRYGEYMTVVQGEYTVGINKKKYRITPGKEIFIPAHIPHSGTYKKHTRTIHWFGGKRAERETR
ncbi:MAG: cupin domain-containing protein [Spirochaetes bacterium]|nr:cupin domain-containing protein [Spirochaetota bacterium]